MFRCIHKVSIANTCTWPKMPPTKRVGNTGWAHTRVCWPGFSQPACSWSPNSSSALPSAASHTRTRPLPKLHATTFAETDIEQSQTGAGELASASSAQCAIDTVPSRMVNSVGKQSVAQTVPITVHGHTAAIAGSTSLELLVKVCGAGAADSASMLSGRLNAVGGVAESNAAKLNRHTLSPLRILH